MTTTERPEQKGPLMDHRELAARAVVARVVADEAKHLADSCRAILETGLEPQEKVVGKLPDGTPVGSVSRTRASASARVTDEDALIEWVAMNRPEELRTAVRSSFVDALKAQAKRHGHAFDEATGEVIPGIEVVDGASAFRVSPETDARDVVMRGLSDLINGGMFALPRGEVS